MSVRHLLAGRGEGWQKQRHRRRSALLRVFAGAAFVLHGWGKVTDVSGFAAEQGVPVVLGAAAAYVQFIGGLLLVVGLLTPLAAFGIGVTMVVAPSSCSGERANRSSTLAATAGRAQCSTPS